MRSLCNANVFRSVGCVLAMGLGAAAAWSPTFPEENGRLIEAPGAKIYMEVTGADSGMPLVMVNGGPGFDHVYIHVADPVWRQLGSDRPVVFYDQRGNGRSPALTADQTCTLADLA